jgi:hypothetical protein
VAIQILQDCSNSISDKFWFDAENNCFCAQFDGALEEIEIYEGKEYEFEGKTYMLYDIGAYSWVWDKVKLDDNYEYRYFHNNSCEFMNIDGTFSKAEDVFDKAAQF